MIQRRMDGSVNFYRGWDEYRNGFGNVDSEFWIGKFFFGFLDFFFIFAFFLHKVSKTVLTIYTLFLNANFFYDYRERQQIQNKIN